MNDDVLCRGLANVGRSRKVNIVRSDRLDAPIPKSHFVILSNFFRVKPEILKSISDSNDFAMVAHDYKFVGHMNPAIYPDMKVPEVELIHTELFSRAKAVFCQSKLQKDIHDLNVKSNTVNLSGNLWDIETIDFMRSLAKRRKTKMGTYCIVRSMYPQKGVPQAVECCMKNRIPYDVIHDASYHAFLNKMAEYEGLVFIPQWPETLSRVVVEAKVMGLNVVASNMVGAVLEPFWNELGAPQLADKLQTDIVRIPAIITETLGL